jgi:hypothetical protein
VHKLGGNKDDPYNLTKGTWSKRYLVLQDDLRYFVDEKTWRKGGAPKGVVSLDNFFVTREGGPGLFTIHAVPWPLICRVDDPAQVLFLFKRKARTCIDVQNLTSLVLTYRFFFYSFSFSSTAIRYFR